MLHVGLIVANAAVLALTLSFTPIPGVFGIRWAGYGQDDWHGFVVPHIVLALGLTAAWVVVRIRGDAGREIGGLALAQPLYIATYLWALHLWPGGDDGGGMSWLLFVGPLTGVPLLLGAGAAWAIVRQTPSAARLTRWGWGAAALLLTVVALGFLATTVPPWLGKGAVLH